MYEHLLISITERAVRRHLFDEIFMGADALLKSSAASSAHPKLSRQFYLTDTHVCGHQQEARRDQRALQ